MKKIYLSLAFILSIGYLTLNIHAIENDVLADDNNVVNVQENNINNEANNQEVVVSENTVGNNTNKEVQPPESEYKKEIKAKVNSIWEYIF